MRTASALTATLTLLALGLAGCSAPASTVAGTTTDTGKTPDTAPVASSTPTPTPTVASEFGEQVKSSRGNLVKQLGQLAGTSSSTGADTETSRFAVTDIVVDQPCDSDYPESAQNGHFLGIHLNVETTPELADDAFPTVSFSEYDWQAYDADGKRLNDPIGTAWSCLSTAQQLPVDIGPGQSVSGWIVLDVAATTGIVVLAPAGSAVGWEWSY